MKSLFLSALVGLISPMAMAAGQGDCMITSGKDLTGDRVSFSHTDDPHQVSAKLAFAPGSLFIASGYALKVFERPYFGGAGLLVGRPLEVKYAGPVYDLHPTAGGYYINAEQLKTNFPNVTRLVFPVDIASLACVSAGKPFPDDDLRLDDASYYNDQNFYLMANPGRADSYQAQVTYKDGKKTLSMQMILGYTPPRPVAITLDLATMSVVIKRDQTTESYAQPEAGAPAAEQMQYLGALSLVRETLRVIVANDRAYRGEGQRSGVPNLELQPVLEILDGIGYGAL